MLNNVSFFVEKCFMELNSTTLDPFRGIFVIGRNTFVPDSIVKKRKRITTSFMDKIYV